MEKLKRQEAPGNKESTPETQTNSKEKSEVNRREEVEQRKETLLAEQTQTLALAKGLYEFTENSDHALGPQDMLAYVRKHGAELPEHILKNFYQVIDKYI